MLGRWLITILISFQSMHLHAITLKANTPDSNTPNAQETEEDKKKKKKKDDEKISDFATLQISGGTLVISGGLTLIGTYFAVERGKEEEKKLEILNKIDQIEKLRDRFENKGHHLQILNTLNQELTSTEVDLIKTKKHSSQTNIKEIKQKHTELQQKLITALEVLNADIIEHNKIGTNINQPHYSTQPSNLEQTNANNRFNFPSILEEQQTDLNHHFNKKEQLSRKQGIERITVTCDIINKQLAGVIKNKKSQIPNPYYKYVPGAIPTVIGGGMLAVAGIGSWMNNIKNLSEAKKIIDKKQELETTQKVTLENLIKEDSKKSDTILEPFISYSSEILSSHQDAIKESLLKNFRFVANSDIIKEKIDEEFKNFKNPAIVRAAILKALSISGDNSKVFTIDELEKKMYSHNKLEETTEYPKFLRKFYSEAIRQLYPLTMADEKKEYISIDIFNDLVEKTQKRIEEHKVTKKQNPDNKVSKSINKLPGEETLASSAQSGTNP